MSMGARAGDWVRIRVTILPAGERAPGIPADTASHPYQGWINGWAAHEAAIGERVTLRTLAGRTVEGTLVEVNPGYAHSFGRPHPALLAVGPSLKKLLED
ncbi:MAG: 2-amino-4-oxopentanoate thiolase subunit OrtA [Acidobacteriota bacterium]